MVVSHWTVFNNREENKGGTSFKFQSLAFLRFTFDWELSMPNPTFRRWTADEIAKLKNLAQKAQCKDFAAQLVRSAPATAVKAHALGVSLKIPRRGEDKDATGQSA